MSIKRTIITTVVALALVAVVAPTVTQATTVADLQAMIAQLTAQLATLSGGTTTAPATGACAGVTFSRNLTTGAVGADVKCLQVILNRSAATQVATTGAGSPGAETTTFGPKTLVAVKKFQQANGLTAANQVGPLTRAKLTAMIGTSTGTGTGTGTTTTGPVSAMLALDTPAAGAVIGGQATADLLHVNFTGNGTVTSVTLNRTGISDQNLFTNVYLFDGNTRISDGYSFGVNSQLVMNGLSINVNGSKTISVRADVMAGASATQGSAVVSLTGFTANGTTVSANVVGNQMAVVSGSLATAYLGANTYAGATPAVNAGTTQYTVWSAPMQVNTRAVMLKTANFKMVGSAPSNALANIRLFVDGVDTGKVATVMSISGSNYASFDLTSAPITLLTGSHTVDVRVDVILGASRTVQLSVQQASDLTVTDPQVGVNIAVLGASGAAFTSNAGSTVSINQGSGSVVVDPTFTSVTNVPAGATNAVIGKFVIHGYGEDVKVNTIAITPTLSSLASTTCTLAAVTTAQAVTCTSTSGFVAGNAITSAGNGAVGTVNSITNSTTMNVTFATAPTAASQVTAVADKGLNNVTLYFNGSQIGSTQSPTASNSALTFTLGSQMIIPAGQDSKLEVRADLQQQSTTTAYGAGTIVVTVGSGATVNAQGQSSQNTFFLPGSATVAGTQATTGLSISSASLVVAKNTAYTSQAVTPNTAGVKIGSYIVQNQSTSESVRLTTLTVSLWSDAGATAALNTTATTSLAGLSSLKTSASSDSIQPTASNTFSINETLAPSASKTIDIFADTHDAATLAQVSTRLTVASIGVTSNISSPGTAAVGQLVTLSTGTLGTPTVVTSGTNATTTSQYVASGATGATNASQVSFNFTSASGTSTINELKFAVLQGNGSITNICVDSAHCAQPFNGVADITGLNLVVPAEGLQQPVQISYASVGTYGLVSPTVSQIGLSYIKYVSGGTTTIACPTSVTPEGNSAVTCSPTSGNTILPATLAAAQKSQPIALVGSVPTVTVASTSNSGLQLGTGVANQKIGEVTIAASAQGGIRVRTIAFTIGKSGFSTTSMSLATATPTLNIGSTPVAGSACTITGASTGITCTMTGSDYSTDLIIGKGQSQTFNLYAAVAGAPASGEVSSVSSSVSATGFVWDDASWNGVSNGLALSGQNASYATNGQIINSWPTSSYVLHQ